jgi:hypothetical protein
MADAGQKTCTQCGELKPVTDFYKQRQYRTSKCIACLKLERSGEYSRLKPQKKAQYAEASRIRAYGLDNAKLIDLMLSQDFCCAICGDPMEKMNIDHCHESGKVRGLLCVACNTGLGKLGDNVDGLMRAVRYLEAADAA